jgi:hypothetical protein
MSQQEQEESFELPAEIAQNILSFVPSRWEAALLNSVFYREACDIEKDYYKLTLNTVRK